MPDAPLLELRGLGKRFGGLVVIDDLSSTVRPGELLGVVGPNGAGKTTLFGLIAGDLRPDAGSVIFAGRDVTTMRGSRRCRAGIGRTYQVPLPFSGMTVFENVLVGAAHGRRARGRAAYQLGQRALDAVGLAPKANEQAANLGLLDRKRLELARALATEPRLLLLDEVAGGLTEPEVAELMATIVALQAGGMTIIWIEHIVDALLSAADRLLCLAAGRVLMDGEPAAVLASREVQEVYLGTTEAGLLPGHGAAARADQDGRP
jgi:branched-chain amino acid transport system ATP-binding protein